MKNTFSQITSCLKKLFSLCVGETGPKSLHKTVTFITDNENYFSGSLVNIQRAMEDAQKKGGKVAFESFPLERANEYIYAPLPKVGGSYVANHLDMMAHEVFEQLLNDSTIDQIFMDSTPPDLELYRNASRIIHEAVAETFRDNPFFRYHTTKFDNGEANGTKKTQDMDDLKHDIQTGMRLVQNGMTFEQSIEMNRAPDSQKSYPFTHVCQCETLSILHGIIAQKVCDELLGDHAGAMMYLTNASNYRTSEDTLVEHATLVHTATVNVNGRHQTVIVHIVDESGFDLGASQRQGVEKDRSIALEPDSLTRLADFEKNGELTVKGHMHNEEPVRLLYSLAKRLPPGKPGQHIKMGPSESSAHNAFKPG